MMTFTTLKTRFMDGTQNTNNVTDANLVAYFKDILDARYQLALAELSNWQTVVTRTASTIAGQQYYHNPVGMAQIESCVITIGGINYPVSIIESQFHWDNLNEILLTPTIYPQFIFPRRDDFGLWPIPQASYVITLNYNMRDRKMTIDDYVTGTVLPSQNSQTIVGTGTTFDNTMVGRWFSFTASDNYWYRINSVTDKTHLTLETSYESVTPTATGSYVIGQAPELPEDAHALLYRGAIADYMSEVRGDVERATWFNNVFWTGDGNNGDRTGDNIRGGLIGIAKRYESRGDTKIITRRPQKKMEYNKLWGIKLT